MRPESPVVLKVRRAPCASASAWTSWNFRLVAIVGHRLSGRARVDVDNRVGPVVPGKDRNGRSRPAEAQRVADDRLENLPERPWIGLDHEVARQRLSGGLIEVQTAVSAPEIEQRVEIGIEACPENSADEDVVVAAIVNTEALAFKDAKRVHQQGRSRLAC